MPDPPHAACCVLSHFSALTSTRQRLLLYAASVCSSLRSCGMTKLANSQFSILYHELRVRAKLCM